MKHADFFSRNPVACINLATNTDSWLKIEQRRDPELAKIIKTIENGILVKDYRIYDSVLQKQLQEKGPGCNNWKKVFPKSYQWSIINAYHTALKHFGWDKIVLKIRKEYWFPDMTKTVRQFIDNCVINKCKCIRLRRHPFLFIPSITT